MKKKSVLTLLSILLVFFIQFSFMPFPAIGDELITNDSRPLSLRECIEIALSKNRKGMICELQVEIAEHQVNQALSSYWPRLHLDSVLVHHDERTNFIFPEEVSKYIIKTPEGYDIETVARIPEKDVTISDKDNVLNKLEMTYPIYTGGARRANVSMAKHGLSAAKETLRRTRLEITYDVSRMYYAVILADRLSSMVSSAYERMKATHNLTEQFYLEGSRKVNRLDFLKSGILLESIRSVKAEMEKNGETARMALKNTMGLPVDAHLALSETDIPITSDIPDENMVLEGAYRFNPDLSRFNEQLMALTQKMASEKAGHFPVIALTGSLYRWDNDYDGGLSTSENKNGWSVGIALSMNVFDGFLTSEKVKEAEKNLAAMTAGQILLKEGVAVKIRHGMIRLRKSAEIIEACSKACDYAVEMRELASDAYINSLIDTKELIEAQIMETITLIRKEQAVYDQALALFDIDFVVGREVEKLLTETMKQ